MARTHAQEFANHVLPATVLADPLAFTGAALAGEAPTLLASLWERAGNELAPISRHPAATTAFTATVERRGLYTMVLVTPPAPRGHGDAAAIVVIGRGDGVSKLTTLACYVVELAMPAGSAEPRFLVVARNGRDERGTGCGEGPLPDPRWTFDHVFALYTGRTPPPRTTRDVPTLPAWYWWYLLDGASAVRSFAEARDEAGRFAAVRGSPVLLLPEIAELAETMIDAAPAQRLRELRPYLCRDTTLAEAWQDLVSRLSSLSIGSRAANTVRTLPLIEEASRHGALSRAQAYELEAVIRSKLAALGIHPDDNIALSQQFFEAARALTRTPRMASGTIPPPHSGADQIWRPLFLDETDLPDHARADHDEQFSASEPTFLGHGGLRAGYAAWVSDAASPFARLVDARWEFRTATAAAYYLRAVRGAMGDSLPRVPTPVLGDETLAFGTDAPNARTYVVVLRVGRVVARLHASEGPHAAAARQVLHAAMLQPIAGKIVQRTRKALGAYWLAVAYPTNAVPALMASPGYDAARLLERYPLLALPDLPAAMSTLGDSYTEVARSLASYQAQLRAHRWTEYRGAMLALVRELLVTDMGDPRVNAAHAHEIVSEMRPLDPDPIWQQLELECQARR